MRVELHRLQQRTHSPTRKNKTKNKTRNRKKKYRKGDGKRRKVSGGIR
jgi:hypothetical protein